MPNVNRNYDVPYLAGSSNDGRTVYIDRRVPRLIRIGGRMVDPAKYLVIHETTEHQAMLRGMPYEKAHSKIATPAEHKALAADGLNWKAYEEVMDGLLAHIEHENPKNPPPDLYLKPYPHNKQVLLKREGQMPFVSQAQRAYFNANRGALERQGVNVDEWNHASKGMKLPARRASGGPSGGLQNWEAYRNRPHIDAPRDPWLRRPLRPMPFLNDRINPPFEYPPAVEPMKVELADNKYADGGAYFAHQAFRNMERPGLIGSAVPGRTDKIPMSVRPGSYVVPADVVSGLPSAQGNTMAGAASLDKLFGQTPGGTSQSRFATPKVNYAPIGRMPNIPRVPGSPSMPGAQTQARTIRQRFAHGGHAKTDIIVAGGEYIVTPDTVARLGHGDLKKGFERLDAFVHHVRKQNIHKLKKLPGPKKR